MLALIRKDLIACRLFFLIGVPLYALWALSTFQNPLGFLLLNVGAIVALTLAPIVVDDKYRIDTLVCFLPPSRSKVVLARYLMALVALLIGLGAQYGFGALLSIWFSQTRFWTSCSPEILFVFCVVPVGFVALYLPCFFRFGLGRGSFAFAVLMTGLGALTTSPLLATYLFSANSDFLLTPEMLQRPETALVAFVDYVASTVGSVRFYAAVPVGGVALVTASVALSIRFFNRRDV